MPEGHVLHRLAQQLTDAFGHGPVAVSSPQGRFADEARTLDGADLIDAEAIGKHLILRFDVPEPARVHIHLGLIGKLRVHRWAEPKGVVRLRIAHPEDATPRLAADLHGPQWCRLIDTATRDRLLAESGPDPLRPDADPDRGFTRLHRSGRSLASLLMDQRVTAGVGNIYRAEVLFRHRLRPDTPGREISRATWEVIWADLVELMADGVRSGRIDTVRPEHSPQAQDRPARDDPHGGEVYVYRRADQPCLVCHGTVRTRVLEGRNLYWCPKCQKRKQART